MIKNKLVNWFEEEAVIFANIPIRWHIIMLTCGVSIGVIVSLAIKLFM